MPAKVSLAAMSVAWPRLGTWKRRYDVPATVIACEFSGGQLREWMAQDHPALRELAKVRDVGYVDLPTGHWPQFTKPVELGRAILASAGPA